MPSFDIVSRVELAEVDNAIMNMQREMAQRFDFKGSNCSLQRSELELTLEADDETKLKQMQELLRGHLARRKIEPGALDFHKPEKAAGQRQRQKVKLRQGIEQELAKRIVKSIKDAKLKVQPAIQGDELRVTGKKRDDLQEAIQLVKRQDFEQPLQFVNFRD